MSKEQILEQIKSGYGVDDTQANIMFNLLVAGAEAKIAGQDEVQAIKDKILTMRNQMQCVINDEAKSKKFFGLLGDDIWVRSQ